MLTWRSDRMDSEPSEVELRQWVKHVEKIKPHNGSHMILQNAPDSVRDNFDIILKAVSNDGYALKYASERLKDDVSIVSAAVSQEARAIRDAGEYLYANPVL